MSEQPTLFVTDPTAEVARVSSALLARGYAVVDVPLSMLISRVSAQLPALIFVDADAEGAIEIVQQLREAPGGSEVEILFFGEQGKTLVDTTDAVLAGASGFLARPLDLALVLRKVQALVPLEPFSSDAPVISSSGRPSRRVASIPPPSLPPSRRSQATSLDASWSTGDAVAVPRLSEELEGILRSAELRVDGAGPRASEPPSPEDEVNAVLPPTLLEALEEPLGEEIGSWGRATPTGFDGVALAELPPLSAPGSLLAPLSVAAPFLPPALVPLALPLTPAALPPEPPLEASTRIERAAGRPPSEPPPEPSAPPHRLPPSSWPPARPASTPPTAPPPRPGPPTPIPPAFPGPPTPIPPTPPTPAPLVPPLPTPAPFVSVPPALATPAPSPPALAQPPLPALSPAPLPLLSLPSLAGAAAANVAAPVSPSLPPPVVFGERDALRLLAKAISDRFSGVLCFDGQGGLRRAVLRDGDLVTVSSTLDGESLLAFLVQRGDLPGDLGKKLEGRLPPFGRHAGAALVAHGHLGQDRLWEALRGHAEWLVGKILGTPEGVCQYEAEAAGRLRSEPSVFGGSTGSEVLVEIGRRVIPAEEAGRGLGGLKARLGEGKRFSLLGECALEPGELETVERCRGFTAGEILETRASVGLASVLLVLVALGVLDALAPTEAESLPPPPRDELDDEALRARVQARLALVEEGDYFAVLGVSRGATPYEIRRAYLELRRSFEPSRILSPTTADLADTIRLIIEVLDEAFEVLRDATRRDRYRRAIEARPPED
jgi:hypothetical protein